MKLALCNEVVREKNFAEQCAFAAALGYQALELAPFTVAPDPSAMDAKTCANLRRTAAQEGIEICGLHWLLVAPEGLSLNGPDEVARQRTTEVMRRLIAICAELGGRYLVHGSPAQRTVATGDDPKAAWQRAVDSFGAVAADAEAAGVTYCIEPLGRGETNFVNRIDEAVAMIEEIDSPAFKTMIDTKAAAGSESESVEALIERWMPRGMIAHVQFNDVNRRGPGQGEMKFAGIIHALRRTGYDGTIAMEPFDYVPDGAAAAARAVGYVQGLLEATEG